VALNPLPSWKFANAEIVAERTTNRTIASIPLFLPMIGRVINPTPIIEDTKVNSEDRNPPNNLE